MVVAVWRSHCEILLSFHVVYTLPLLYASNFLLSARSSTLIITLFIFDLVRFATKTEKKKKNIDNNNKPSGKHSEKKIAHANNEFVLRDFVRARCLQSDVPREWRRLMEMKTPEKCCARVRALLTHTRTHATQIRWIRIPKHRWREKIWRNENPFKQPKWKLSRVQRKLPEAFNAFNYKWLGRWFARRSTFQCEPILHFFLRVFYLRVVSRCRTVSCTRESIKIKNWRLIRLILLKLSAAHPISRMHTRAPRWIQYHTTVNHRIPTEFVFFLNFNFCLVPNSILEF